MAGNQAIGRSGRPVTRNGSLPDRIVSFKSCPALRKFRRNTQLSNVLPSRPLVCGLDSMALLLQAISTAIFVMTVRDTEWRLEIPKTRSTLDRVAGYIGLGGHSSVSCAAISQYSLSYDIYIPYLQDAHFHSRCRLCRSCVCHTGACSPSTQLCTHSSSPHCGHWPYRSCCATECQCSHFGLCSYRNRSEERSRCHSQRLQLLLLSRLWYYDDDDVDQ